MSRSTPLARDPVTGTSELHAVRRSDGTPSADELADQIRGTRARMSATIDQIEERLAPARIADEVKRNMRDTLDEVRDHIHPRQMAKRAGDNMLDTIRENPIPSLAAGLSIGYLIMKGFESDDRSERRRFRRSGYEPYQSVPWGYDRGDRPWEYDYRYEDDVHAGATPVRAFEAHVPEEEHHESRTGRMSDRAREMRHDLGERGEHLRHELGERGERIQHEVSERAHMIGERASNVARRGQHQARQMGREVSRTARRAERSIEQFVHENPLVAGLITAGIGAMVGAAFPATRREDELMGHARDRVVDQARDMAREKGEQAREAARHVGEEARHHAQEVAETAKQEAKSIGSSDGSTSSSERSRQSTSLGSTEPGTQRTGTESRESGLAGVHSQQGNVEPRRGERPPGSIGGERS